MKKILFLWIILFCINCKLEKKVEQNTDKVENTKEYTFFLGTYTQKESKGIYKYTLTANGKLKKNGLAAITEEPSFLALSADKKYVVSVNEVAVEGKGFVSSYAIKNDSLEFLSKSSSGGAHPCFVKTTKNGMVLVANYSGGNIGLLTLGNDGKLSELLDTQQHYGKGTTDRQKSPHAHSVWIDKNDKNKVISVDLGTNELWLSEINDANNTFTKNPKKLAMAPGAGPRHVAFHPTKSIIYVLNELDNTITLVMENNGFFEKGESISSLPPDFDGISKSADIHISKDGKFLYASNRGHDSIAIFKVNPDNGSLTLVGFEATKGKNPRNFSLSPDDSYLIVANQDSDNLISFKRDTETGLLAYVDEINAPTPVCILFTE